MGLPDFAPEEFSLPEFEPVLVATGIPRKAQTSASETTSTQTTVVKLLTEDPNVVIYWLIESEVETASTAKQRL